MICYDYLRNKLNIKLKFFNNTSQIMMGKQQGIVNDVSDKEDNSSLSGISLTVPQSNVFDILLKNYSK